MSGVLLEARPFRPFKSSEEYLYAMKEDLAEWLLTLYPHLRINVDNFMDRLETGVALCEHANAVKVQAAEYVHKKEARKMMTRSVTGSLFQARQLVEIADVKFFATAKAGTFFARDNVSNFIHWCRQSLRIIECLLFETDDLILRKNEKHVVLCLLEVARRGAKFGMLAPMLIQMERQIDREIAADQKRMGASRDDLEEDDDESDSEMEDEQPVLMYGPLPQIVTNDLKSLDEMVRDLVEKCTCPTQFPMIRVSEGKYRIGETKVLIFVRILRSHVMVRVGGGWDTLSHYLDKHDPCRCRTQHRSTQGARLVSKPGMADLRGARVFYDRSPPLGIRIVTGDSTSSTLCKEYLGPPTNSLDRARSRSPSHGRSVSPGMMRKSLAVPPPADRSRSPTPSYVSTHFMTKPSLPNFSKTSASSYKPISKHQRSITPQLDLKVSLKPEPPLHTAENLTDHSDNVSEVSDEGYRSLGIVQNEKNGGTKNRSSLYSQNSLEDVEDAERQISLDCEDDTNDAGLRRTQFSHIYKGDSVENTNPEKTVVSEKTFVRASTFVEKLSDDDREGKLLPEQNSMLKKRIIVSPKLGNTWNGRQKSTRPSLTSDIFDAPSFNRNSPGRRSESIRNPRRFSSSSSANTSPTKGRLKEELLKAVKNNDNDLSMAEQVKKVLKKYGSLTSLYDCDSNDISFSGSINKIDSFVSPRKDTRPDNIVSRIPAPVLQYKV